MPPDVLVGYMYYAQTITSLHTPICVKLFRLLINVSVKNLHKFGTLVCYQLQ